MLTLLSLAAATLISEDLACVAAGVLVAQGRLHPLPAIGACAAGIIAGDVALWAAGRWGARGMAKLAWLPRPVATDAITTSLRRHAGPAIVASRFFPGTRLPLYLAAGAIGVSARTFIVWSSCAALLWTPALVLLAAGIDRGAVRAAGSPDDLAGAGVYAAAVLAIPLLGLVRTLAVPSARRRATARLARWRRWEFWPMWLFYVPVAVWLIVLSIRYRGFVAVTASNPGIPDGGLVGESKFDILRRLPPQWTIPSYRLPSAPPSRVPGMSGDAGTTPDMDAGVERARDLRAHAEREGWTVPLILKPDVGQRGSGVKCIRSWADAERYLTENRAAVLAQPYHEGPFEAGVFYYRFPGWQAGRILSITDKVFPEVVGNGSATLEALIWSHPRYRLQAATFLARHRAAASRVLADGERFRLAIAGNHCQGTLFRDGQHLITPALEARIDGIARHQPGFYIGRFDIRYRTVDGFTAGEDLAIVELNGATAESTNIYDPDRSIWSAYRTLFHQWALVFAIGDENRRRGAAVSSLTHLVALLLAHLTSSTANSLSD